MPEPSTPPASDWTREEFLACFASALDYPLMAAALDSLLGRMAGIAAKETMVLLSLANLKAPPAERHA